MRIALIGAGGLAKEYYEVARMCDYDVVGTFSRNGGQIFSLPHLGYLDDLLDMKSEFDGVAVAMGMSSVDSIGKRERIVDFLNQNQIKQVTLISPYSRIHETVVIEDGVYVHHDVIISCDVTIGASSIINTSARIGHDCEIGSNVSVGPCSFIGGTAKISDNVLIGASSNIKNGVVIGTRVVLSMGVNVVRNVKDSCILIPLYPKPIPF